MRAVCVMFAPSAHVHLNEPGRTDWEGFCMGTRAAVAGGFTMVVDMPLTSIPLMTTVKNLDQKRRAVRGQCWSDVVFWGGLIPNYQVKMICCLCLRPATAPARRHQWRDM